MKHILLLIISLSVLVSSACSIKETTESEALEIAKQYARMNAPIGDYNIDDYHTWVWSDDDVSEWNVYFAHKIHGKERIKDDGTIEAVWPGCPESFGISVSRTFGNVKDLFHCN
jgi:hypothetical protein